MARKFLTDDEVLEYLKYLNENDDNGDGSNASESDSDSNSNEADVEPEVCTNASNSNEADVEPEVCTNASNSNETDTEPELPEVCTNAATSSSVENIIFDDYVPVELSDPLDYDFTAENDTSNIEMVNVDVDETSDNGGVSSNITLQNSVSNIDPVGGTLSLQVPSPSNASNIDPAGSTPSTQAPSTSKKKQQRAQKAKPVKRLQQKPKKVQAKAPANKKKNPKPKPTKKPDKPEFIWRRFPMTKLKLNKFKFDGNFGPNVPDNVKSPVDFFSLFFSDELINTIVAETNRYAEQKIIDKIVEEKLTKGARLNNWTAITSNEVKIFFALLLWMGLDKKPSLYRYWSSNVLYQSPCRKYMSRNRFQVILAMLHVTNNQTADTTDKLYKLGNVLKYLNDQFAKYYTPGKTICIDESMMPWRGRLGFRQYIPSKRHKYGIKFFKLCLPHGYTHKFKIYVGAEDSDSDNNVDKDSGLPIGLSERVVLHLCESVLDNGRTLFTDNFYTSVSLAKSLLKRKTHLVGTLRSNRKHNPKMVIQKKLVKGQMIGRVSQKICVYKWLDKRDVMFLSTTHKPDFSEVKVNRYSKQSFLKPTAVIDYNKAKTFINVSDQLKAYACALRRSIKWYRKVLVELICNTSIVNAYILYMLKTGKKLTITDFREQVALQLFQACNCDAPVDSGTPSRHIFTETKKRGRCVSCYSRSSKAGGRKIASKLPFIHLSCTGCDQKFMCMKCFNRIHVIKAYA